MTFRQITPTCAYARYIPQGALVEFETGDGVLIRGVALTLSYGDVNVLVRARNDQAPWLCVGASQLNRDGDFTRETAID